MSSFFEAAFAKSTVRLAESDNMAALDAEFYDATAKITDEDLKDSDLKLFQQAYAKAAKKGTQKDCSKFDSVDCSGKKKSKLKGCNKKNKKLAAKKRRCEKENAGEPAKLPSVCSDGLMTESCLASMMEKAKACQKHKECSIDACKMRNDEGRLVYGDAKQSTIKGCPQKCFPKNVGGPRDHYIKICDSVLDNIREAYKELKKESGDPRFQ